MFFNYSMGEKFFPLFFLSSSIYILLGVQYAESRCLITSKSTGLCQECASEYYYPDLFKVSSKELTSPPLFPSNSCLKKRSPTETFNKTIYVSNQPCLSAQGSSSICDYNDLGDALVKEAEATQSYQNGHLKFLLIGSAHQISSGSLPFPGIELFKRSIISITIETISPEQCALNGVVNDCPISSTIFLRTQSFSLFVSEEFLVKNIIIDGVDLNLAEECQQPVTMLSCCNQQTLSLDFTKSTCGLKNKSVFTKIAESLSIIPALFSLLTQDDSDEPSGNYRFPILRLENFELLNMYLLKNESGWQALIKTSPLPSQVLITNAVFRNNYLPLGILKQMNFNEDPYFSLYTREMSETILLNMNTNSSTNLNTVSSLTLSNVTIDIHHSVLFIEYSTGNSLRYPDSPLFETKAVYSILTINVSVTDSQFPTYKKYLLFKFSGSPDLTGSSSIISTSLRNSSDIAILKILNLALEVKYLMLMSCKFNLLAPISCASKSPIFLSGILADQISCGSYSIKFLDVIGVNSLVINSTLITRSTGIFFSFLRCESVEIFNSAIINLTNSIIGKSSLLNISDCGYFIFAHSVFESLSLGDILFSLIDVKISKLINLTHNNLIMRNYLYWIGKSQRTGNMTLSDLYYTLIQGIKSSSFIPESCLILSLDTYHTLEMNRVRFIEGINIVLMYNLYLSVRTIFDGLLFERIKFQNFYFILGYISVDIPVHKIFAMTNSNFSEFTWIRDIEPIYFINWSLFILKNIIIRNFFYNEMYFTTNKQRGVMKIFLINYVNITNCNIFNFSKGLNMLAISNCLELVWESSTIQSVNLVAAILGVVNVKKATLNMLSLNSSIFSYFLYWMRGNELLGNISISNLNFSFIQGQQGVSFIPLESMILFLDSYHTLEMKKVRFFEGLNIVLMYNLYLNMRTIFDGLLFERIKFQTYYFILGYASVDVSNNKIFAMTNSNFSDFSWLRDIEPIYIFNWMDLKFENNSFQAFSYNETYFSTNNNKRIFYFEKASTLLFRSNDIFYKNEGFMDSFIRILGLINSTIIGNTFKCLYKPSSRVSAMIVNSKNNKPYNLILRGNFFENFAFFSRPKDIFESNGLISISGSPTYSWDTSFIVTAILYENSFKNMQSTVLNGVLGLLNVHNIIIYNNTFQNCKANKGGGLSILLSLKATIETTLFLNCSTLTDGGAAIFQEIEDLKFSNLTFINCYAALEGGALKILGITQGYGYSLTGENTSSGVRGGFMVCRESADLILINMSLKKSSSGFGGGFFIENINSSLINISTYETFANSGGFMTLLGSYSKVILENLYIVESSTELDGAVLQCNNVALLRLLYFRTENCKSIEGMGIITLTGFSLIISETKGKFEIIDTLCLRNYAKAGSCLSYISNNELIIEGMQVFESIGSLVTIKSEKSSPLFISGLKLKNNNLNLFMDFYDHELTKAALLQIFDAKFSLENSIFSNNRVFLELVNIDNCYAYIYYCIFENFLEPIFVSENLNLPMTYFRISRIFIHNLTILDSERSKAKEFIYGQFEESNISIIKSVFRKCSTLNSQPFLFINCLSNLRDCIFQKNSGIFSNLFSIYSSDMIIDFCQFLNDADETTYSSSKDKKLFSSVAEIYVDSSDNQLKALLLISNSAFLTSNGISIVINKMLNVTLFNCTFTAEISSIDRYKKAILASSSRIITINNSYFGGYNLGVIQIENLSGSNFTFLMVVLVINTLFSYNSALENGGVLLQKGNIELIIEGSKFFKNKAIIGGVLLVDCEYFSACKVNITNSTLDGNLADIAPTIISKANSIYLNNTNLTNNTDSFGLAQNNISSYPLKIILLGDSAGLEGETEEESARRLIKDNINEFLWAVPQIITSGKEFNTALTIVDSQLNYLIFDNFSRASLTYDYNATNKTESESENIVIEKNQAISLKGLFNFINLKIITKPNTTIILKITINREKDLLFQSTPSNSQINSNKNNEKLTLVSRMKLFVRPCLRGEILMPDFTCYLCLRGTFSLADPMTRGPEFLNCEPCPQNAICIGGDKITPLPGFWRASNLSTLIIECPVKEACLGATFDVNITSTDFLTKGECLAGHKGALCYECIRGLARVRPKSLCKPCDSQPLIYIKMTISALFMIGYVLFQANVFSRIEKKEPNAAVCIKLLLNHFQTVGMIGLLHLGWTIDFSIYFSFQDYISFLTEDFLGIDCFVQSINENMLVMKIIFTTLLPIILSVIIFFIWLCAFYYLYLKQIKAKPSTKTNESNNKSKLSDFLIEKMRISTLVIVYILYPEILRKSFSLMSCLELDNASRLKTLSFSPDLECWNKQHTFWVLAVALPGILFWGILIPIFILIALIYYKKEIIKILNLNDLTDNINAQEVEPQTLNFDKDAEILMSPQSEGLNSLENKEKTNKAITADYSVNQNVILQRNSLRKSNKAEDINFNILDNNPNIFVRKIILNFGYFFRGYNKNCYYWEIVMFSRKFLLIFIGVFTEFFPNNSKATLFFVLINFYLYVQVIYKPFKFDYLNKLENYSLFVCCLTGIIGILLLSEKIKSASIFFVIFVALINLGFILIWLHKFIKNGIGMEKVLNLWQRALIIIRRWSRRRHLKKNI